MHGVIKCNQKAWPKSHTDMNTEKCRKLFWKRLFQLLNNVVFGKSMKNVGKRRDIKLVTTNARSKYVVSEPHSNV